MKAIESRQPFTMGDWFFFIGDIADILKRHLKKKTLRMFPKKASTVADSFIQMVLHDCHEFRCFRDEDLLICLNYTTPRKNFVALPITVIPNLARQLLKLNQTYDLSAFEGFIGVIRKLIDCAAIELSKSPESVAAF